MADLTYPEVGATQTGPMPAGYHRVEREVPLGRGDAVMAAAAEGLLTFDMLRRAGLHPRTGGPRAAVGMDIVTRFGVGPVGLSAPGRIVWVEDGPDRAGFAYGTLPGHPESGEEGFLVTRDADGAVRFVVRAFSRPATAVARLGGPLTRVMQTFIIGRYVAAMRRLVAT